MKYKICTKCGKERPATTKYFHRNKTGKYGLLAICKICKNIKTKQYWKTEEGQTVRRCYNKSEKGKCVSRKKHLKRTYGITLKQYDQMFEAQNGVCAICNLPELMCRLSVDHNHETGKIRELLCHKCNRRLEVLEDIQFVRLAHNYLNKHNLPPVSTGQLMRDNNGSNE